MLSVVHTKIAVSTTIEIHDACIKVAVSLQKEWAIVTTFSTNVQMEPLLQISFYRLIHYNVHGHICIMYLLILASIRITKCKNLTNPLLGNRVF